MSQILRLSTTILSLAIVLCLSANPVQSQEVIASFESDKQSKSSIRIQCAFKGVPKHGFLPIQVVVKNNLKDKQAITLRFESMAHSRFNNTFSSGFSIFAPEKSISQHDLLVPLSTTLDNSSWASPNIRVSVSGKEFSTYTSSISTENIGNWPSIAVSNQIAERNLQSLNKELASLSSAGSSVFGFAFEPEMLPSDWRGFSGFDIVMLTDKEWVKLLPGARTALLDWARFGGHLHIYTTDDSLALNSLGIGGDTRERPLSSGEALIRKWDGKDIGAAPTVGFYKGDYQARRKHPHFQDGYGQSWALGNLLNIRNTGSWKVVLILIIFGVLVGPVNLFVFAKPGQRHRLFFTTPIISAGTSLLLILLILLEDGTGGRGFRIAFVELQPGERKTYTIQEQISQTGALFQSGFEPEEDSLFISPVLAERSTSSSSFSPAKNEQLRYSKNGNTLAGDWFQSRSEQSHYMEALRSTRSRIEQVPSDSGDVILLSSLETPLDQLYYIDQDGDHWASPGSIVTGTQVTLEKTTGAAFKNWLNKQIAPASKRVRKQVKKRDSGRGMFFATAGDPGSLMVDTLDSIHWKSDSALLFGPVVATP